MCVVWKGQFERVEWNDYSDTKINDGRIHLVKAKPGTQIGESQISQPTVRFRIDGDIEVDSEGVEKETVSWMFAGKTRTIQKITEPIREHDFRVVRYIGTTKEDAEPEVFLLAVGVIEGGEHSEEDIRKIFESFRAAGNE